MKCFHLAALAFAAALPVLPAHADSLLFSGVEGSGHRAFYGQVGGVTALPGSTLGNGWVARATAYGLTYRYQGAPGRVDGDSAGGDVSLGYQRAGGPGWWGLYAGPVYRHTDLSPRDPSSKAQGGDTGVMVMGESEYNMTRLVKLGLSGNYAFSFNDAFWTRARLQYGLGGTMYLGPEAVYQGDRDYRAWSAGLALSGIALDTKGAVQAGLKGGVRKVENLSASPYGGLEVGYKF